MSRLAAALAAFAAADPVGWPGLPARLVAAHLSALRDGPAAAFAEAVLADDRRSGAVGQPPRRAAWLPVGTDRYAGGLRLWLAGQQVLVLEGIHPLDPAGEFLPAPDLGAPEATCDALLGPLLLPHGEQVHAGRGLAVRRNPDNGLLLGLVGFAPTTAQDYCTRLRPVPEPARPLGAAKGVAR
jgi:hypothetical protein